MWQIVHVYYLVKLLFVPGSIFMKICNVRNWREHIFNPYVTLGNCRPSPMHLLSPPNMGVWKCYEERFHESVVVPSPFQVVFVESEIPMYTKSYIIHVPFTLLRHPVYSHPSILPSSPPANFWKEFLMRNWWRPLQLHVEAAPHEQSQIDFSLHPLLPFRRRLQPPTTY